MSTQCLMPESLCQLFDHTQFKACAIREDFARLIVTHRALTERARLQHPDAVHISVDNFLSSPQYNEVVEMMRQ